MSNSAILEVLLACAASGFGLFLYVWLLSKIYY